MDFVGRGKTKRAKLGLVTVGGCHAACVEALDLLRAEGVAIAREMLMACRQMTQGAQISAPMGRYSSAVDVLEALGTEPAASR